MKNKKPSALELLASIADWWRLVERGADPIEAMHGHECGPQCWHWDSMSEARRAEILRKQKATK